MIYRDRRDPFRRGPICPVRVGCLRRRFTSDMLSKRRQKHMVVATLDGVRLTRVQSVWSRMFVCNCQNSLERD